MTDIEKHDAAKTADECEAARDKAEKHTEPWLVMGNQRNGHFDFVLPMAKDKDFQANARLISASPVMLAALRYTLAAFDADGWTGPGYLQVHRGEAVKMMRAAIAKATGAQG